MAKPLQPDRITALDPALPPRPGRGRVGAGAIALSLLALMLPACAEWEDAIAPGNAPSVEDRGSVLEDSTRGEDNDNLAERVGQVVTIRSEVAVTDDPNSFVLTSRRIAGGDPVLVFNATGTPVLVPRDGTIEVLVRGEVRRFQATAVERDYGVVLDPETFIDYERQPVVFAESIALAPDPNELTDDPGQFYDHRVAVNGRVGDITTPNTFTLVDRTLFGGDPLLVLNTTPNLALTDGQGVTVVGELRPFVATDIDREYDLTWDLELQQQLELEFQDRPVLVARDVYNID